MRHAGSDPRDDPQALLAVWLLGDYAVDVERPEDGSCVFVGKHNHTMAAWRDLSMIDCGYCILVPVRGSDDKWHEWDAIEALADVGDHCTIISETSPLASPVRR